MAACFALLDRIPLALNQDRGFLPAKFDRNSLTILLVGDEFRQRFQYKLIMLIL